MTLRAGDLGVLAPHAGLLAVAAQPERQPVVRAERGQATVYPCQFTLPMLTSVLMSMRPRQSVSMWPMTGTHAPPFKRVQ